MAKYLMFSAAFIMDDKLMEGKWYDYGNVFVTSPRWRQGKTM
jgi:hypothetical protein